MVDIGKVGVNTYRKNTREVFTPNLKRHSYTYPTDMYQGKNNKSIETSKSNSFQITTLKVNTSSHK